MREIKFRVWNDGAMKYTPLISMGIFHFKNKDDLDFEINGAIMQFTGLTDKKGTEIYEGDIVKLYIEYVHDDGDFEGFAVGEVRIYASKGVVLFNPRIENASTGESYSTNQAKNVAAYRAEVIGDIHTAPELLK